VGEDLSVISEPPGIIIGLPFAGRNTLLPLIARVWSENSLSLGALNSGLTGADLALVSRKAAQNIYIGRLANESLLSFPPAMRIILLAAFFCTVYLIIFLIFNIRQDDITIIQSRLKKLRIKLLEEYYEHKDDVDWKRWKKELEHRRDDLHAELKRGLNTRTSGLPEIDDFIDKSWDDITAIIGSRMEKQAGIDEAKRKALETLDEAEKPVSTEPEQEEPAELEALDEAEELETMVALDEAEKPEPVEQEEPTDLEALDKAEESELEEPATLEALDEAEELEPIEPEPEEPEKLINMTEFYGFDLLELENSNGPGGIVVDNPASALEFSPGPEELEREKEEAARSMAEHLEIQSPFAAIFSTLAEVEFEPEPMESLEPLEKEGQTQDNSPEVEAEELDISFTGPHLSIPFLTSPASEIIVLEAEDDEEAAMPGDEDARAGDPETEQAPGEGDSDRVFAERDGVIYIDESVRAPDKKPLRGLNKSLKNLIDSILNNT
jgi:hypothetical protein